MERLLRKSDIIHGGINKCEENILNLLIIQKKQQISTKFLFYIHKIRTRHCPPLLCPKL